MRRLDPDPPCTIQQGAGDNGNITGATYTDNVNSGYSHTFTYCYDTVDRLTQAVATGSPAYNLAYNYDQYGNGWCVGGSGGGVCPALNYNSSKNQLTSIGGAAPVTVNYDAAGNQLNDQYSIYQYDAEGRVTHSYSTGQWQYPTYNALGQRVEDYQGTASDSMKLYYPRDIFGDRTGIWDDHSSVGWVGWDVYWSQVAGQRLNMGGSSAYIGHADAVGSTTMETDPAGAVQWDMTYYPWGQIWQQTGTRQTGVYAGLDWQVNDPVLPSATREYSDNLGRWMTPDPGGVKVVKLDDPQTWNMYAYVGDNPTSRNDPSGLYACNGNKQQCQAFKKALNIVRTAASSLKKGTFERKRLDAVLKFYGTDNGKGPAIAFANLKGAVGVTHTDHGKTAITLDPTQLGRYGEPGRGETVAHEGTHGMDQHTKRPAAGIFWTIYDLEYRAYRSESYVDMGLGKASESDQYPGWASGMPDRKHVLNITRDAYQNALYDCRDGGCTP